MRKTVLSTLFVTVALVLNVAACASKKGSTDEPQPSSTCGDSALTGNDKCDDGNVVNGDGCNDQCQIEAGWICPVLGQHCVADLCGDGIRAGVEQCDLGKDMNGADPTLGCTADCKFAEGWVCDSQGCRKTICGDGVIEGTEQCEHQDGNNMPFDGCSATCKIEPTCPLHGPCNATCGDGIIMLPEVCDDGNTVSGDGCSADCMTLENGFSCSAPTTYPPAIEADVIYRDFLGYNDTAPSGSGGKRHPDFQAYACTTITKGLVQSELGSDRKPQLATPIPTCPSYDPFHPENNDDSSSTQITSEDSFNQWYRDTPDTNKTVVGSLTLGQVGGTTSDIYRVGHEDVTACNPNPNHVYGASDFFPLDAYSYSEVWGMTTPCKDGSAFYNCDADSKRDSSGNFWGHDFSFTSEVRYWFTYQGGEHLLFIGDDDVWVFINGYLAVDIGGLHSPMCQEITLDENHATKLGLTPGMVYEVALFNAERQTGASDFTLTLGGFVKAKTVCTATCGDGVVAGGEECDNGPATAAGTDPTCTDKCKLQGHSMGG